jgi:uncharacterized membrane protein
LPTSANDNGWFRYTSRGLTKAQGFSGAFVNNNPHNKTRTQPSGGVMAPILQSLGRTVIAGLVILILLVLIASNVSGAGPVMGHAWGAFVMRWLHVVSGVMWIGLLWYFNFVQIPSMPKIPDEQKPAIGKVIAPTALFWFRYAALATVVTGGLLAWMNGYLAAALGLQVPFHAIGIGMWLALIMAFNVWFVIWPAQQKALGLVEADDATKAAAATRAMMFSRTNTLLSIPMLYAMIAFNGG